MAAKGLSTNMHVTREQAATMLGAVLARKRMLKESPLHALDTDGATELMRLVGVEGMLNAALERIRDRQRAIDDKWDTDRRNIRDRLVASSQPADLGDAA